MSTEIGDQMGLDETSRAIGRLEATQEATKSDVAEFGVCWAQSTSNATSTTIQGGTGGTAPSTIRITRIQ